MRKSTRASRVDPPNELWTFQNPALGGDGGANNETQVTPTGTMADEVFTSLAMILGRHL